MGKKIIITAGPTNERIDDVMAITNMSTGQLSATIANTILGTPATNTATERIYYLSPKLAVKPMPCFINNETVKPITVTDAESLKRTLAHLLTSESIDAVIHTAAVGDYRARYSIRAEDLVEEIMDRQAEHGPLDKQQLMKIFENPRGAADDSGKMSSYEPHLMTMMELTPKVIGCIKELSPRTLLIGCKLLDGVTEEHLLEVATKLLYKNKADLIIANDLHNIGKGKHPAILIQPDKDPDSVRIFKRCETKYEIASAVRNFIYEKKRR